MATERLCIHETVASGTDSNIALMQNNLFYIEGDDLTPGITYLRVDGDATVDYDSSQLNAIAGVSAQSGNFTGFPLLDEFNDVHLKSTANLQAGSDAIDMGVAVGGDVPDVDLEGDSRPAGGGVDIGHDERP
jgi:hypothetical protein